MAVGSNLITQQSSCTPCAATQRTSHARAYTASSISVRFTALHRSPPLSTWLTSIHFWRACTFGQPLAATVSRSCHGAVLCMPALTCAWVWLGVGCRHRRARRDRVAYRSVGSRHTYVAARWQQAAGTHTHSLCLSLSLSLSLSLCTRTHVHTPSSTYVRAYVPSSSDLFGLTSSD